MKEGSEEIRENGKKNRRKDRYKERGGKENRSSSSHAHLRCKSEGRKGSKPLSWDIDMTIWSTKLVVLVDTPHFPHEHIGAWQLTFTVCLLIIIHSFCMKRRSERVRRVETFRQSSSLRSSLKTALMLTSNDAGSFRAESMAPLAGMPLRKVLYDASLCSWLCAQKKKVVKQNPTWLLKHCPATKVATSPSALFVIVWFSFCPFNVAV